MEPVLVQQNCQTFKITILPKHLATRLFSWKSQWIITCKENNFQASFKRTTDCFNGQEPWSSGYGMRLIIKRLWVKIPSQGGSFLTFIFLYNCIVAWPRPQINEKETGDGRFWKKTKFLQFFQTRKRCQTNLVSFFCMNLAIILSGIYHRDRKNQ